MTNYICLDNQIINLTDEQVKEIKKSLKFRCKLAEIPVGETFTAGEYEFIVLEHSKATTAVILKNLLGDDITFGSSNNYKGSNVDKICEDFAEKLADILGSHAVVEHTVDLTSDDGLKDYGKIQRRASLLTANQYRRYIEILDKHKIDAWWWLATAFSTPTHDSHNWTKAVSPSGCILNYSYSNFDSGVRPFCILKSNIFVS